MPYQMASNGQARLTRKCSEKFTASALAGTVRVRFSSHGCARVFLTLLAIRAKHISSSAKIFGTSKHEKVLDNFYNSGAAKLCPPDNSAHISSHSAVKASESATMERVNATLRKRREIELDDAYKKACKRAQAKGRPVPARDQYYYGYGYPYMMMYPYMCVPMYGGVYYADPYCMPMGAGMAGACAAGTCSGGVAAGGW